MDRLIKLVRKDELPYGYSDKKPESVELIDKVLGGRNGIQR